MADQTVVLGRSTTSPVENKARREVVLPGSPSADFILDAPCRILKVGGRIGMSVSDLPGSTPGKYLWESTSDKLRLVNATGPQLVIEALKTPSVARGAEIITVTRLDESNQATIKKVALTVARATFKPSKNQQYGYDDFDTPDDHTDDHVCLKSGGFTFVSVQIEGGAVASDFFFISDNDKVCTMDVPTGSAQFDLKINGGAAEKSMTMIRINSTCRSRENFASIAVHVYSEKKVVVVIAKISDFDSPATALEYKDADYASFQSTANDSLKEAVVKFNLVNLPATAIVLNIPFDPNRYGAVSFDINAGGGQALEIIRRSLQTDKKEDARVVIVRKLRSFYFLKQAAAKGSRSITVVGDELYLGPMQFGSDKNLEEIKVVRSEGNVGFLASPLQNDHIADEAIEFPAAAWSTDPILLSEGDASLEVTKWTILHEVGHRELKLSDIKDNSNFMNHSQDNTENRLRYCPRILAYKEGETENQWELIPRSTLDESQK